MKKRIMKRSARGMAALTIALLTALTAVETAQAAYWNRGRNRRGSSDDSGGSSSSAASGSSSNSRGKDLDRDGIPNISDPDVDSDGILNGDDRNVDGGVALSGKYRGKYIGDRLPNDHPGEKDIDDDGLNDDSSAELDIDGDGLADDSPDELDIDGDGRPDDSADELDIDGDGNADDNPSESDTDGDGRHGADDSDDDGDGRNDDADDDDDGDGRHDGVDDSPNDGDDSNPGAGTPIPAGPVGDGTAPADISGLVYVVRQNNGAIEANLTFTSATAGRETDPDGDNDGFTYVYNASGTTATLRLQLKSDKWDEYDLNYATGSYVRREFDKNALKDTDTGTFNLDGAAPPPPPPPPPFGNGNGSPVGDGTAPASISGATWVVSQNNGRVEANLLFTSATAGSENDPDGDIDPFSYTYSGTGTTGTLRLEFKPGKWDEYDLNFATGQYTRREFKNGALDDTDTGLFGLTAPVVTPPAGGNDDGTPDQGSGDL